MRCRTSFGAPALLVLAALTTVRSSAGPGASRSRPAAVGERSGARARALPAGLPLQFEENVGQVDPRARFLARGSGCAAFFTPQAVLLTLPRPEPHAGARGRAGTSPASRPALLRMQLVGARAGARLRGEDRLPGKV